MESKKKSVGRPEIDFDYDTLEKLCSYQATAPEIASWFNMSVDTLENRVKKKYGCNFSEFFERFKDIGKMSLRRKQFSEAMKGNTALLIHLGKNHLNQRDRVETDNTTKVVEISYEQYLKDLENKNG